VRKQERRAGRGSVLRGDLEEELELRSTPGLRDDESLAPVYLCRQLKATGKALRELSKPSDGLTSPSG
jgi:hypothetical protein